MKQIKPWLSRGEALFKILFLCTALFTFNGFIYPTAVQPMLVKICIVLGALVILGRVLFFRDYIQSPCWIILVLFCVSFLFSIAMNWKYGVGIADVKWVFWNGLFFFCLYVTDKTKSVVSYRKEFGILSHIIIVYTTVAAVIGSSMMFRHYSEIVATKDEEEIIRGFRWERLWGIYTDPNYGAVLSVIGIFLAVYFLLSIKKKYRYLYLVAIVANYLYLVFSDSRTAKVAVVVAAVVFVVFYYVQQKDVTKKRKITKAVATLLILSIVLVPADIFLREECNVKIQKAINKEMAEWIKKHGKPEEEEKENRDTNLQKDVSNGRLSIWTSGLEVWKESPIYGTGYNSVVLFAKEHTPDTYIINTGTTPYMSLHNGYLNVLVYQGLIGFGLLAVFCVGILRYGWKVRKGLLRMDVQYLTVLVTCILVVAISMLFLAEGLYTISPGAFVLWTFLGYLMHYMQQTEHVEGVTEKVE